jgi:hypothetical protein
MSLPLQRGGWSPKGDRVGIAHLMTPTRRASLADLP